MDLATLKLHLHVTHNSEDDLIASYQEWAEAEIKDSVYPDDLTRDNAFFDNSKIFERAVVLLTAFYFENRLGYTDVKYISSPDGVTSAIQKLRGAYPYESEQTY
ncbi:head-tail connector protein [Staphylococcus succinus]|uniref:head-tail connector protein n=1 Tax=Staphylococcus succinus TaxID=61015 RepID=UPI00301D0B89